MNTLIAADQSVTEIRISEPYELGKLRQLKMTRYRVNMMVP